MDNEHIDELFASLGQVTIRRMFGGQGVYCDGVIVAIVHADELRLKADAISSPAFAAAGSTQWAYLSHRGEVMMPYWTIPDDALDDPDAMSDWVRLALDAGLRAETSKPVRKMPASKLKSGMKANRL